MWQSVILWGGIQHQLTLTTPPKNQFTVSVNSTQMRKIEMNTSLWTPRLLMMDGKDKISLSHRDFYLVHIKLQVSNFRLKTHFIKEMERFHITVLRVFFLYQYQSLNVEDKKCWGTGRKTAVREKECTDKGLSSVEEDWSGKTQCGWVQLCSTSRIIIR